MTTNTPQKVLRWVRRLLALGFAGLVLTALVVVLVVPRATHSVPMTVLTGSMTPTIPVGSLVMVEPVDPGTLRVGDIATYQPEPGTPTFITHRILKITTVHGTTLFTFKGDANRGADIEPVAGAQIRGKVLFHVPYLGALRDLAHTRGGLSGLAVLLLAVYAVSQLLAIRRDRHRRPVGSGLQAEMLIATFRTAEFEGLTAPTVAELLGMRLLAEDEGTFTLVTARTPQDLSGLVALLQSFCPLGLVRHCVAVPGPASEDKRVRHALA